MKPCPVKYYRKEDLDFIFNLYNTDHFTQPFEPGHSLTDFSKSIGQLYANLQVHRNPDDDENSEQANIVFYNLNAILKLELPPAYDTSDWRCLAMDALRYDCSEAINGLLAEYNYNDHIHNHHLYTHTPLLGMLMTRQNAQAEWLPQRVKEIKQFLSAQQLPVDISDEYFGMVLHYTSE